MPQAIVFDAVGTLIHADPPVADVYHLTGWQFGSQLDRETVCQRFRAAFAASEAGEGLTRSATGEQHERQRWRRIVEAIFDDLPDPGGPLFHSLWQHFAQPQHWRLFDDVALALADLAGRGYRLAMASNFDRRLHAIVQAYPVLRRCEHSFISSEIGFPKPDGRFFAAAAAQLGLSADQLVLVGDDWTNDVLGARAAGWQAVWLNRKSVPGTELHIRSLGELAELAEHVVGQDSSCRALGSPRQDKSCPTNYYYSSCDAGRSVSRCGPWQDASFPRRRMKLRHPLAIRAVAFLAAALIRLWMSTLRVRVASADGRSHPVDPRQARYLYAFWHEALLAPLVTRPQARVLISQHVDGELIAQVCRFLGIGVIRGSTARGGSQALLEMIRGGGGEAHLAITPDGPRGPRRELKPGIVMVASQAGLPIVPIGVGFTRAWRAASWDHFAVPVPFSTLAGVIGKPIVVAGNLDRAGMQHYKQLVQRQLLRLTGQAEDWADRIARLGTRAKPPSIEQTSRLLKSA